MAWTCSGISNETLVAALQRERIVRTPSVAAAMLKVDRAWFLPSGSRASAYEDSPQPIGYQATISAPHMHAIMLEILAPYVLRAHGGGDATPRTFRALDVGSGSGYLTAVLAQMCETQAVAGRMGAWEVVGVEHIRQLAERSAAALAEHFPRWTDSGRVRIVQGDGRRPEASVGDEPFDLIHVGAAAEEVHPSLVRLLRDDGCLVIPVGPEHGAQDLFVCTKDAGGTLRKTKNCGVRFVPLTSVQHQTRE